MVDIEIGVNIDRKRCKKCGAPLRSGFRACEKCGQPVNEQAVEGQQTASVSEGGEVVIGVIANATQARGLGRKSYNLVITNRRLIGAELTSKMIAGEAERVAREAKARGEGLMAQMSKRAFAGINLYERYYSMPAEAIIAENKDNWAIPIEQIESCDMDESDNGYPTQLTVRWEGGKNTFSFDPKVLGSGRVSADDAKAMLSQAGVKKVK
jgi:hypothetical protein